MTYVLIQDGIVVQKQPYAQDGFIEVPDEVACGFVTSDGGQTFSAPAPAPAPAPEIISAPQFLCSLNHHSLRAQVDSYVAGSDQDTRDWYARAVQFERHNPRVLTAITALSITDAQADAVWAYGASL